MASPDYVWEKMYVAIGALCGEGTFEKRWHNATVSALIRLTEDDLDGQLGEDLKYILSWTQPDARQPSDVERSQLVEKMLHVMLETHPRG